MTQVSFGSKHCIRDKHMRFMERKLVAIRENEGRRARREFSEHTDGLANLLSYFLRTARWSNVSAKDNQEFAYNITGARSASVTLDAISFINEKVLSAQNGKIEDIKLKPDLGDAQSQIHDMFDTGKAPKRGFVYIAWRQSPEQYFYVGKAGTHDRLNLSSHGKLANTVGRATTLSLVFPNQSSEETLSGLEASIMHLLTLHMDEPPELNAKAERVPSHDGSEELAELHTFLRNIATMINA